MERSNADTTSKTLLEGLFKLHDITYQPPYRKGTVEETDGFFTFRGFDYLLEARWRKTQPVGFANSGGLVFVDESAEHVAVP